MRIFPIITGSANCFILKFHMPWLCFILKFHMPWLLPFSNREIWSGIYERTEILWVKCCKGWVDCKFYDYWKGKIFWALQSNEVLSKVEDEFLKLALRIWKWETHYESPPFFFCMLFLFGWETNLNSIWRKGSLGCRKFKLMPQYTFIWLVFTLSPERDRKSA